jgi:pimeloyl-ACP methyl ester carboxylesterase
MQGTWNLRRRITLSGGEISYDVLGYGPPLILVHGTPSRSYIWRDVARDTAEFEPLLPSIGIPVSIIWGEQDAWLAPALAERLHELIPGSDLLVLPETGHFAMEDSPQEVATALFEFFTDCEIRPR